MSPENNNGWPEWSNKVLGDLKDLNDRFAKLSEQVVDLRIKLAILNTKATLWGGGAGIIVSGIVTFIIKHFTQ